MLQRNKIVKEKGEEPTEFEDQVAQVRGPACVQRAGPCTLSRDVPPLQGFSERLGARVSSQAGSTGSSLPACRRCLTSKPPTRS